MQQSQTARAGAVHTNQLSDNMPAFPLTIPTGGIRTCRVSRQSVVGVNQSPFTLQEQVYAHPGRRWMITLNIKPLNATQAAAWVQFFYDINGREGTFNFNLNPYCPSLSPAPGTKVFRLTDNNQGWDISVEKLYSFTVSASEAV